MPIPEKKMKHYRSARRTFLIGAAATTLSTIGMTSFSNTASTASATIRLGVLKFGTVNWELNVIKHHGLDLKAGLNLDVVGLANKDATAIAFNAGDVNMIVTDWIWTSRQRDAGADCTFVPYSMAAGSIMVHPDSGINRLDQLRGKRIGVAGSPIDKSWLLLRAYSLKTFGEDIATIAKPAYAAPPLLNEKFKQKEFDAVLNYWNYTARLRAADMVELIKVQDLLPALGVPGRLPLIGYVFSESWAEQNLEAINAFFKASEDARKIIGDNKFIEAYIKCSLSVCETRDVKGMYKKARLNEIKNFTGVNDDYDVPDNPDLIINTENNTLDECVDQITQYLEEKRAV